MIIITKKEDLSPLSYAMFKVNEKFEIMPRH